MLIRFISHIDNNGKINKIDFKAPVTIDKFGEFTTYEFKEPSRNEMNRIEISENKINIMAGPSTLEMELNKDIDVFYKVDHNMVFKLITHLKSIKHQKNQIHFNYELKNKDGLIGLYQVALEILK